MPDARLVGCGINDTSGWQLDRELRITLCETAAKLLPARRRIAIRIDHDADRLHAGGLQRGLDEPDLEDVIDPVSLLDIHRFIALGPGNSREFQQLREHPLLILALDDEDARTDPPQRHRTSMPRSAACRISVSVNAIASPLPRSIRCSEISLRPGSATAASAS